MSEREPTFSMMPPKWCEHICKNAMKEECVNDCAIKRQCEFFTLISSLQFDDLPPFPHGEEMTLAEHITNLSVYVDLMSAKLRKKH